MAFLELLANGIVGKYFSTEIPLFVLCYILVAFIAYALGSINFAIILSKLRHNDDIRRHGSGNAGMTNMLRTYGKTDGILTFLGDALKTALAIFIGMLIVGSAHGGNYAGGLFAILGHIFPCYYGFKGGKGVVASAMTILMLNPAVFGMLILVFVIVVAIWRYISLGSVICAMLYPMLTFAVTRVSDKGPATLFALVIAILVIVLHKDNIVRLMQGKESKLSFGKKSEKKTYTVKKQKNRKNGK